MTSALPLSGDADDVAQGRIQFRPPDNEARTSVSVSGAIGRSADAGVLLVGLARYTIGLQIELADRCRIDPDLGDRKHPTVDAGLLPRVGFADGRTAVVAGRRYSLKNWPAASELVLTSLSGTGRGGEWSTTQWFTPAPPPGDLVLTVADPVSALTGRLSPWMPKHFELRSRRLRSCGRTSLVRRIRPFSRRRSMYRPAASSHGYFRR